MNAVAVLNGPYHQLDVLVPVEVYHSGTMAFMGEECLLFFFRTQLNFGQVPQVHLAIIAAAPEQVYQMGAPLHFHDAIFILEV